jgi:hypothetical protein
MTSSRPFPPTDRAPRNGERLRLGLTGLGAIFLIVMVVAAGLRPASPPAESARQGESLAVLGVAPGAGPAAPPAKAPPLEAAAPVTP